MGQTLKNIWRGFGQLNIAPHNNYADLVPTYSPQEALAKDFAAVGKDMRAGMANIDKEISKQAK
ncbi:MAG: hypothetical protein R8M45_10065 [Ghiorsea sp.]